MIGASDVSTQSIERASMEHDLELISDVREGGQAIRRRAGRYLPQYEQESSQEYRRRVQMAPWRPEFVDALRSLASKPFGSDVKVAADTPEPLAALIDDVDGRGNNLTRFARAAFTEGLANGVHAILVDYPTMAEIGGRSLADERAIGARPYWLHVPVTSIIALRTEMLGGREIVTHLRFHQTETKVDASGFGETTVQRIQVVEPDLWQNWEQSNNGVWVCVESGELRRGGKTQTEVPVALFFAGDRMGQLQTRPPLRDLAEMQVELLRALSRQDEILTYSGSPMLAAIGMSKDPNGGAITVGPKTILFAPPVGDGVTSRWEYVSPDAGAIGEIRQQIAAIVQDMRRLGMQPTLPAGRETATAASIEAAKAHSALQSWALGFKDCLEHAFRFTAEWMGIDHATAVEIFTDFAVGDQNTDESKLVLQAEKERIISKRTAREELQRRNILGPQFDLAGEDERLAEERDQPAPVTVQERVNVAVDAANPPPALEAVEDGLVLPAPKSRTRTKRRVPA